LVAQEFVHGADLGVVAGEGELGQVPGVLDGPQRGVVVVGGAAYEVTRPAGVDHHRWHQRAAVQAAGPAGAAVRVALGQYRGPAGAVYGLMRATRAGLARMSVYSANGLCLDAYSGWALDGQKSVSGWSAGIASM